MADRYWVGGTANWDSTAGAKWATTSGGAGGAAIPTSADDVFFDAASTGVCTIQNSNTGAKSINCTGFTGTITGNGAITISGSVTLSAGMTFTHTGVKTFDSTGTITSAGKTFGATTIDGAGHTVTLNDNLTIGSSSTITLTRGNLDLGGFILTCGLFSSSNSNTRHIFFGSGSIALNTTSSPVTCLNIADATNFTWSGTGGFTHNLPVSTTVVFGTTGGTTSNAPNFTAASTSSSRTLTITNGSYFKNVNFTGNYATVTGIYNACGDLTLGSDGTYTSFRPTFLTPSTVICNGKRMGNATVNGSGIIVLFGDNYFGSTLTLIEGTINAAFYTVNVNITSFSSNNSNNRLVYMGDGTWTLIGSGGAVVWDTSTTTGLTLFPYSSTINTTGASAKTFNGGGLTYYNLNQGGVGTLTISGSNTFNNITNSVQPATVRFTAGTTQTVSNFGLSGTAGNLITINSTTPGSQFTLSDASGTINAQYLAIQDSNATGGAVWNALYSTNLGNNTGWIFPGGDMFLMFM